MSEIQASSLLSACLIAEGLVPEECADIEILMPVDGIVQLSYRVNVTNVDLEKLGRAFARAAQGDWPMDGELFYRTGEVRPMEHVEAFRQACLPCSVAAGVANFPTQHVTHAVGERCPQTGRIRAPGDKHG